MTWTNKLCFIALLTFNACSSPRLINNWQLPAANSVSGPAITEIRSSQQIFLGLSALVSDKGNIWALVDNGFGLKKNSSEFLPRIYSIELTKEKNQFTIKKYIELKDPFGFFIDVRRKLGVTLNGADIDPESLVVLNDGSFLIGDEFGPGLFHFSANGVLMAAPIYLKIPKGICRQFSCDIVSSNLIEGFSTSSNLPISKGVEALAANSKFLYALLEGPLLGMPADQLLGLEFDLATLKQTENFFIYKLEKPYIQNDLRSHKIGDMVFLHENRLLVIESDGFQREEAKLKAIFEVDLIPGKIGKVLDKKLFLDLLKIDPPMTFTTIEALALTERGTLLIANDNNYPTAAGQGRTAGVQEDTEIYEILMPF